MGEADDIALDDDELLCLRSILEMLDDETGPFGALDRSVAPERIEAATRRLVERGLLDRPAYRPDRDLVRRLLVTCEPDHRLVLLAAGPASAERIVDAFERTGAWVRYGRRAGQHVLGAPEERRGIRAALADRFLPRRSAGDFVRLSLDPAESFAFLTFAQSIRLDGAPEPRSAQRPSEATDPTLEGAILRPGGGAPRAARRRVPDEAEWAAALDRLLGRDVLRQAAGRYQLKPYLLDLARGITHRTRFVLSRSSFGAAPPEVLDATLVPVPGSLFSLRTGEQGELQIVELAAPELARLLDQMVGD